MNAPVPAPRTSRGRSKVASRRARSQASSGPGLLRPPLKWAGGKRWQVPHLIPYWQGHEHRRLVEPFCGGLAVALGLNPERALLNDVNPHLIHFYKWLKQGLVAAVPMRNSGTLYYAHRRRFNRLIQSDPAHPEAAALFYYLNRTGYNGLCRFNRGGEFNVPFGRYKTINYTSDFSEYAKAFRKWEFTNQDFESIRLDTNDFVYADPPYDVVFTSYAKDGFFWEDQVRTADWLAKHPGPVVLVNQATVRIVDLYSTLGYKLSYLAGPRFISCTGDRTPVKEVVATRNL